MRFLYTFISLIACANPTTTSAKQVDFKSARFFVDGQKNATLLRGIRQGTENRITFNRHFSPAYVSCGPGCESAWFVDRTTGGVVEVPQSRNADLIVGRVEAYPDSDMIYVTYMMRDGLTDDLSVKVYRLQHNRFTVQRPSAWPNHIRVKGAQGERCMTFIDEGPLFDDLRQLKASLSRGGRTTTILHPEGGTSQGCLSAVKEVAKEAGQKVEISTRL